MKPKFLFIFAALVLVSCAINKSSTVETPESVNQTSNDWDFCECVVKIDSITFAIESDKLTIKQETWLMERWEYVDQKCKELTAFDNSTPQSRANHEKRVKKCLE